MWLRPRICAGLALASAILGSCGGKDTTEPGGGGQGSTLQGTVQSTTDGAGIPDARIVLRRSAGDSVAAALSDSTGRFSFPALAAGGYRIGVRLPPGYAVTTASDTLQTLQISLGQQASVALRATPITQVVHTPQAGRPDTLTIAGAQVIVTLPTGVPPPSVQIAATPAADPAWGVLIGGTALVVTITPSSSGAAAFTRSAAASASPPISLDLKIRLPSWLLAPGFASQILTLWPGPQSGFLKGRMDATVSNETDPFTATTVRNAALRLTLPGGQTIVFRAGVIASTLTCGNNVALTRVAGGTGPEPLILIHGIDLPRADCRDYDNFVPATDYFPVMIDAFRQQAELMRRYTLYTYKYPTYAGVANASAGLLRELNAWFPAPLPAVAVVAHSMGGLVIRQFMLDNPGVTIDQVITTGTPHNGTAVADASRSDIVDNSAVQTCYENQLAAPGSRPSLLPWWVIYPLLKYAAALPFFGMQQNSQGVRDLQTSTSLARALTEPSAGRITTLAGATALDGSDHGAEKNSFMTITGCYLSVVRQETNHDALVAESSARPAWSLNKGPRIFPRDHIDLEGAGTQQDAYLPTIINYLLLPRTGPAPVLALVSGNNQVGTAGQPLPLPITVEARTAQGLALPNVVIQFAIDPGGGAVVPAMVTTDGQGRAVVAWTLGDMGGVQHLNATIGGYASATISAYAVTVGGVGCPNYQSYSLGTSIDASLTATDCTVTVPPDPAIYYMKEYAAAVPSSRAIQVRMTSVVFTPWATVHFEPSGWSLGFVASAGSTTATTNVLLAPGAFAARLTSAVPGRTGPFNWSAIPIADDVTSCTPFLLTSGVVTSQRLTLADCQGFGKVYDRYLVGIPHGWRIVVKMNSSSLDAYLDLYRGDDQSFVTFDDDGGGGTNAHLTYSSPSNTSYYLHATSFLGQELGAYTLSFTLVPPPGGAAPALRAATGSGATGPGPLAPLSTPRRAGALRLPP